MGYFCPKSTFLHLKYIQRILLSTTCVKIHHITYAIISFFTTQLLCIFLLKHFIFSTEGVQTFRLSAARVKVHQILMSLFSVMRDNSSVLFQLKHLYAFDKSSTLKCKFSDLPLLTLKFTKLLMSFLEPRVSFLPNFPSLVSVMRHNSSVLFHLNLYMFWTKEDLQSTNFLTFNCSHEN